MFEQKIDQPTNPSPKPAAPQPAVPQSAASQPIASKPVEDSLIKEFEAAYRGKHAIWRNKETKQFITFKEEKKAKP